MISFGFTRLPISWRELFTRTIKEFVADNGLGLAAQLAYYFFFALFPAILVGIALASFLPLGHLLDRVVTTLAGVVPDDVITIVQDQLRKISGGDNGGILTFGLLLALWSSSAAMVGIIDALNRAYDINEARPWWKVRLLAIALTIVLTAFLLVAFGLVLVGPTAAEYIARVTGLGPVLAWAWMILQWPLIVALVSLATGLVHYYAPDAEQRWVWITPGAVLTTVLWLVASLGFKLYVSNFGAYTETYGTIGGVMVLLLWFYITGLVMLFGAELNAEIEHASPYGKAVGEKVPGQKRAIGVLATERYQQRPPTPPAPPAVPAIVPRSRLVLARVIAAAIAAVVVLRSGTR